MADVGSTLAQLKTGLASAGMWAVWITIGVMLLSFILLTVVLVKHNKKKWNTKIEFKLIRSDGKLINAEWGKGFINRKKGYVTIKRKGMKAYIMKPFDIKKYLQGANTLTVVQKGIDDWLPVLPSSFTFVIDDKTGERASIMDLAADLGSNKSWKTSTERELKGAFSIQSLIQQYQVPIAIGIVIICNFLGFAILWGRLPSICN